MCEFCGCGSARVSKDSDQKSRKEKKLIGIPVIAVAAKQNEPKMEGAAFRETLKIGPEDGKRESLASVRRQGARKVLVSKVAGALVLALLLVVPIPVAGTELSQRVDDLLAMTDEEAIAFAEKASPNTELAARARVSRYTEGGGLRLVRDGDAPWKVAQRGHVESAQFTMPVERSLAPGAQPFALTVFLSPESPVAGETTEITAEIKSQTSPHARTVITFFVDGQEADQLSGALIPPFETASAVFAWTATKGAHALRIELASAAGVVFATWEGTVDVPAK